MDQTNENNGMTASQIFSGISRFYNNDNHNNNFSVNEISSIFQALSQALRQNASNNCSFNNNTVNFDQRIPHISQNQGNTPHLT